MAKVEIYSTRVCPYCVRAKQLLDNKGVEYTEYHVDKDHDKLTEMMQRCDNRRSVPQILINDQAIGGFDELSALEHDGKLDIMLNA